jgi:uncharacterized membrane protein
MSCAYAGRRLRYNRLVPLESKQIGVLIDRPVNEVYEYASDPANLPEWAPGLGSAVAEVDGRDLARLKQLLERADPE